MFTFRKKKQEKKHLSSIIFSKKKILLFQFEHINELLERALHRKCYMHVSFFVLKSSMDLTEK